MKYSFLYFIDVMGIAAFSISGVFAAMEKRLDIFGVFIMAFVTSIGGGTIRDLLLGNTPVSWLRNIDLLFVVFIGAIVAIVFRNVLRNFRKTLLLFDSLGLGLFTIVGIQKGLAFDLHPLMCLGLGTITACFGGVLRDISLNNIPLIFQKEIYASASLLGGGIYLLLRETNIYSEVSDILCIVIICLIRLLAVRLDWRLPGLYSKNKF
ncbi:MAG: trimeric intracellular cation channel family protein [Ferruginibacter sp.]|nr:trimeric intracellular cation channel family protein [Ferruginibacter sp.]